MRHQAADGINPVNATRTASSRSASVKAAVELQPRNNPLKEDATLLNRYAVGGSPDSPKLRIGEGEHAAMVAPTRWMSIAILVRAL